MIFFITSIIFGQDPELLLKNGRSIMKDGNVSEAESLFVRALQIDPTFAPAHVGLSECWLHKGDLNKANEHAIKAVQMDEEFRTWSNDLNDIRNRIQNGKRCRMAGIGCADSG